MDVRGAVWESSWKCLDCVDRDAQPRAAKREDQGDFFFLGLVVVVGFGDALTGVEAVEVEVDASGLLGIWAD